MILKVSFRSLLIRIVFWYFLSMTEKIILHIDFDSFFASVEQQYNPLFRNRPLGVTATNGRNCIIASSREAKRLGIKTATRVHDAEQIFPGILLTPAHFVLYSKVSKKFLRICSQYAPEVEMFSIDEAFMDVTHSAHLFGGVFQLIKKLKAQLVREVGEYITASVGIAYNKMLAKLGSGLNKPNGITHITPKNLEEIYKKAVLTDVCGIGSRVERRLNIMGIYTLLQLRNAQLPYLVKEFGAVKGQFLKSVGLGLDVTPVISYTQAPDVKSVSRNYCLPRNEYNQRVILQNMYELCEEVGIKLRRLGRKGRSMGLYLGGNRSEGGFVRRGMYSNLGSEIFVGCKALYDRWQWNTGSIEQQMVRQMSVFVSELQHSERVSLSLFTDSYRTDRLWESVDKINTKYGDHTIRNGFLLYADKLTTVPNGYGSDRYERTKLAEETVFD